MTAAPPAANRRGLIDYAIGFDLVVIAVGIGLLFPGTPLLLPLFIAAVGLAAWRGGHRVGAATAVLSLIALAVVFAEDVSTLQIIALAVASAAAVFAVQKVRRHVPAREPRASKKASRRHEAAVRLAAESSRRRRETLVPLAVYAGLPLLVVLLFTNISDVLIRNFPVPSVLQLLIAALLIPLIRYRDAFRPESALLQPIGFAVVAYLLFYFASSVWARDPGVTDAETIELVKSLVIMVVVASLAVSWRALRSALTALVAAAVLLSAMALVQVAIGNPDLQFGGFAELEMGHVFGDEDRPRPAGPVGDTNYFARILVLAVPVAVFLGTEKRKRAAQIGYTLAAAIIALAILFTLSRGAMLAVAAVAVLLVAAGSIRLTLPSIALAALLVAALIPTPVGQRMATLASIFEADETSGLDHSTDKRRQLLEVGWLMFNDHPVAGVGAGNFGAHYPAYANIVGWSGRDYIPAGLRQYPHNQYLEIAAETGVAGLLLFLGAMAVVLAELYRARRTLLERGERTHAALVTAIAVSIAGYLVASIFLHSAYHRYLWLFIGFAAAAVRLSAERTVAGEDA